MQRCRPVLGEAAVEVHPSSEHGGKVDGYRQPNRYRQRNGDLDERRREQRGKDAADAGVGDGGVSCECEDEGQQVEPERQDPEQRHRGNIRRDVRGGPEHKTRRHECERKPPQPLLPGWRRCGAGCVILARADVRLSTIPRCQAPGSQRRQPAEGDEDGHHCIANRPEPGLLRERERRFDDERVRHQRTNAAGVAGRVQEVGVASLPVVKCRKPPLKRRGCGGHDQEREADHRGRETQERPDGTAVCGY